MTVQATGYYISKKSKLLKSFDRSANLVRSTVVSTYGESLADTVIRDARREYEKLIPLLPPVDGAPTLRSFLIIAAQELAVFRAMTNHGKTAGEAWEICHMALRLRLRKIPKSVRLDSPGCSPRPKTPS